MSAYSIGASVEPRRESNSDVRVQQADSLFSSTEIANGRAFNTLAPVSISTSFLYPLFLKRR